MSKIIRPWVQTASELLVDCRVFTVHRTQASAPDGNPPGVHDFFVVRPRNWINVIPITPDGHVVLIEQYRHGIERVTLEIPGGMIDAEDASPEAAAARELLEETGYLAGEIRTLGVTHPNPAIQDNRCWSLVALNCRKVREPKFDSTEDIAVRLVPLDDIPTLIRNGSITHALVVAAFYLLNHPV